MNGAVGHMLWALGGALLGGVFAWLVAPGLFWAALIGGAMTAAAIRVGYVLMGADDGESQ